ncbi:uncharacterized protein FFNC_15700 [Fusarium fujikuroi]|jgi:hypothetical protein
MVFSS